MDFLLFYIAYKKTYGITTNMKTFLSFLTETTKKKIIIWTNPHYKGASMDIKDLDVYPVKKLRMKSIKLLEPVSKMENPKSKKSVKAIKEILKSKDRGSIPPILVRKYKKGYQIIDGHHRFHAHKALKLSKIRVRIIPDEDIEIRNDIPKKK
jgi:hypothetical protein